MSTRSHIVSSSLGSIKLPVRKPPLDNKAIISPLQIEWKENDNAGSHVFVKSLQFISQDHKHKKGVKKTLALDPVDQKDPKNVNEDSTKEEGTCTSNKRRLKKEHFNDQTTKSPLKRKKKSTKTPIAQRKSISTKT